ncbi:hypothetical protein F5880DRAFT_1595974 [Lentinula raphanica]|nr:hypothetical protein F5880DRAFT_1595974 [Lentinula raphanica]
MFIALVRLKITDFFFVLCSSWISPVRQTDRALGDFGVGSAVSCTAQSLPKSKDGHTAQLEKRSRSVAASNEIPTDVQTARERSFNRVET